MTGSGSAAVDRSPELAESYRVCEREVAGHLAALRAISDALPPEVRPYFHALNAFASRSGRIADDARSRPDHGDARDARDARGDRAAADPAERRRRFARWRADTLAELAAGHSAHPLRRAFVDTVRRWELDRALVEEFLDATGADGARPPCFETRQDQRRHLRGVAGTITELWAPLLGARGLRATGAMSALGEARRLADILEVLPLDLAAGRCHLPREDLRRLGLTTADLGRSDCRSDCRGDRLSDRRDDLRAALDELVESQQARLQRLLEQALPATWLVAPACRPFLHTVLLGAQLQYDEVTLVRSRVLTEGLTPLSPDGSAPRRRTRSVPAEGAPAHVAVIMDGNRRWAEARRLPARYGHQAGQRAALRLVNAALRLGVRHLSLYAFSTENWDRPPEELTALFDSLADGLARSAEGLHALGVRIRWCGRRDRVDESLASSIALVESLTSNNGTLTLTVCVDYGGREELAAAARGLAAEAVAGGIRPEEIGPADLARHLYLPDLPDVDLLIRTSGEQRISNFLPWHLAYAELLFDPTPWPDYDLARLREAVRAYAARERRFGGGVPAQSRKPREPRRPQESADPRGDRPATAAAPSRPGEGCTPPAP
ncbi:polyprenyl diphosphate synthase [Kitasatospora sp. NPDC096204]|uniref:polyprenyl diphosphate synthase n=1 Tax=Kitasatospora sp. NPDC096204 TaxID=3364094 RepID=UPI0038197288